jgi:outer membrane protein assembly factor BamB
MLNNYIKKSSYKSVRNYRLIADDLYISDQNKTIYKVNKDGTVFVIMEGLPETSWLAVSGKYLLFRSIRKNELTYFDTQLKKIEFFTLPEVKSCSFIYPYEFKSDFTIVASINTSEERKALAVDLDLKQIKIEFQFRILGSFLSNDSAIFSILLENDEQFLFSADRKTGSLNWRLNLSSNGEIRELLGIVNNLLWVTCYLKESVTKDYHTLIALDVKTGEIIFSRNDMDHFHSSACVLNESENTIISLSAILDQTFLMELDALNGEIKRDEQLTDLEQKGFVLGLANSFTLFNNQLYIVVADVKTIFGKSIAILNLKDLKVVWSSKITEGKVSLAQDPQVTDTHLYVLDTYNTLHIFEKESM